MYRGLLLPNSLRCLRPLSRCTAANSHSPVDCRTDRDAGNGGVLIHLLFREDCRREWKVDKGLRRQRTRLADVTPRDTSGGKSDRESASGEISLLREVFIVVRMCVSCLLVCGCAQLSARTD